MSEGEAKEAVGVCAEVVQKPGSDWVEFHINVGSKYPVRLSTKLDALIKEAKAVGGDVATWHYKESDGNPNPNKPGTFYKNRYLSSVELGGTVMENRPNASGSPTSAAREYAPDLKDRMIVRQTCLKAAAALAPPVEEGDDSVLTVIKAAARFETWVYRDIDEPPFESGPSLADDDIPF